MGEKTSGVGHFTIPTSPAIGTTVAQNASANTYTAAYVQLSAAAPAAIFITGIYVQLAAGASVPTYMSVQLATGAAASEVIVGQHNMQFGPTSGVAATAWGVYKAIYPPIAVANGIRIAAKTASSVASALSWAITLECINQANVVDDGVAVAVVTTVTNQLTAAAIATGVWQDATAGDFTTASSIGKTLYIANVAPGGSGGLMISGSNAGTTTLGALTITGATTHTGNVVLSDGLTISAPSTGNRAGLDIAGNGTGAALKLVAGATGVGLSVAGGGTSGDGIKVTTTSGHGMNLAPVGTNMHGLLATGGNGGTSDGIKAAAGTGGVELRAAITGNVTGNLSGSVGSVTGAVGSVTGAVGSVAGLTASNLDAAITSRMASYTQPTGFLAATFPAGTVANTTNITAGTITTTTNLTNAATAGDFTATMKTSIGTAVAASAVASVTAAVTTGTISNNAITAASIAADAGAEIADAVWDELLVGHVGVGSAGLALTSAGALGTPLDAAGVRAAIGLASANLDTQIAAVKTDAAAVKVQTDKLTFTVANKLDVNILVVNGISIIGSGTVADPMRPA